jgi:hypothetical protein
MRYSLMRGSCAFRMDYVRDYFRDGLIRDIHIFYPNIRRKYVTNVAGHGLIYIELRVIFMVYINVRHRKSKAGGNSYESELYKKY